MHWVVAASVIVALFSIALLAAILSHSLRWRSYAAMQLYVGQCDVALLYPRFSNPQLMKLDLRDKTADGDGDSFERYEWYVARLVYVLDETLRLGPATRWSKVAKTQLGNHKKYLASDYYSKQGYLDHYSARIRRLIEEQRNA